MKEYNFDENKNIGETVRIDDIKLKLNEMENGGFDDYDDYDDLDDYDESYDEDDDYEDDDYDDEFGQTAEVPQRIRNTKPKEHKDPRREGKQSPNNHKGSNNGGTGKLFLYVLIAVLLVAVVAFASVFAMGKAKSEQNKQDENQNVDYFYGVVAAVSDNKFEIIDTQVGKTGFYTVGESVTVTKEDGRKAAYSSVERGDILHIGLSKDTKEIVSIEYNSDVWEKEEFENIELNTSNKTISNGITTYNYDKNTLFIYNGDFIKDEDLSKEDVVNLKGIGDMVWTVEVEKYHGFIELENVDRIENPKITIDGKNIEFVDNKAPVSVGTHSLGISGANIDTLTVDIHITAGETYPVDMAAVQEKTGVLMLSVNVDNSIIVVDGKQVAAETPVVLKLGSYPISVSAEGYKTYSGTVNINEPLVETNIALEKIEIETAAITVESTPPGATVYANNAIIGVTPFTTQINYGDYHISIKKDGYEDYNLSTSVNEEQKVISVLLTEG